MSAADNQFRALIDRILRSREAEDEAKQDTKEIYAEAKSSGYDKTAMGALVRELRSKDKNPAKFEEKSATLDLYRDAYERASHVHAREGRKSVPSQSREFSTPVAQAKPEPAGSMGDEIPASIPHSQSESSPDLTAKADAVSSLTASATPFKLRPHCQHPANCAGYGAKHCHSCTVASATLQHGALA